MGLHRQVELSGAAVVRRRSAALVLMAASGFAGLGYQIVWTQQNALWLGHESAAVLAVVTAFFGGLAAGAFALGSRIAKSARPARWYAGCEFVIAAWSFFLIVAMPTGSGWLLRVTGVQPAPAWQWAVALVGTFLLFLPATAAMGATLPAMVRVNAQLRGPEHSDARSIAALYASNTFGAVVGVLASAFWLVPELGLARTAGLSIALNLVCGAASLVLFSPGAAAAAGALAPSPVSSDSTRRRLLIRLAVTGFLGIGYEVLVVRVLSQVTEDTVYTFAMLLAVYLVGTSAGAAGYRRYRVRRPELDDALADRLLGALAAACLIGTASLWIALDLKAWAQPVLGGGMAAALAAEAVLAIAAFGPATIVMGAVFSHLTAGASAAGLGFGHALGVNTLGGAVAPAVFGVLVLPSLGSKLALLLVCLGYLTLTPPRVWSKPLVLVPAGAALALALLAPRLAFIDIPMGGKVLHHQDGVMAAVTVVEDADGIARLRINNRQQEGSSATYRADARQAWLPLLLHPAPARALFLGLGTGVTAGSAAEDPTLSVDAVELLPEVIQASAHFRRAPRLQVLAADARRYVRVSDRRYDVIVSDNFHPARAGSGSLYTVEHFQAVRRRLEPAGLFCQWLPLHQLDVESLRSIVQSFLAAYPHALAVLASNSLETPVLGLVARGTPGGFDLAVIQRRLAQVAPEARTAALGLEDEFAVLGSFVAGPQTLRRLAGDATLNTDDRPVVAYRAPHVTYAPDSLPRDRLLALLRELSVAPMRPTQVILPPPDPAWPPRLAAYWKARDRFIEAGQNVRPSPNVVQMLAQVREPLLAVLRLSPEFRPAYDPLLSMATALARPDVSGARALLTELTRIQPQRNEAPRVLASMDAEASAGLPTRR